MKRNLAMIEYRGYTIEENKENPPSHRFIFAHGSYDGDPEDNRIGCATSLDEAKKLIDFSIDECGEV